ncbi:MAG: nicotinate (nicotinamide) nucleotide adenylyltransferase, partial [Bacilli bacterium]|nr:nicotinate (nicotinamide) nucleotide adenylyltransferase [Bacilli bacterium]
MANYILFGGTFDPIHNGHIRIANAAKEKLNADIIFIPARSPRWKSPTAFARTRVEMLELAIKNIPGATISEFELNSESEINYSIDTVRYFKNKQPDDNFYFIIGADQVNQFYRWKDAEELSNLATLLYVNRPGYDLDQKVIKKYKMINLNFLDSGDISS